MNPCEAVDLLCIDSLSGSPEVTLPRSAEKELIYPKTTDQDSLGAVVFSVTMVTGSCSLRVGDKTRLSHVLVLPVSFGRIFM